MASLPFRPRSRDDFKIAIICALPLEADLVYMVLDKYWAKEGIDFAKAQGDQNAYTLGVIGKHNIVLVHMPGMGTVPAAAVSVRIRSSFPRIEAAFVVGICGASPTHPETHEHVKLGDCIISTTLIEYDFGRQYGDQFIRKSDLEEIHGRANPTIRSILNQLKVPSIHRDLADRLVYYLESLQKRTPQAKYPIVKFDEPSQVVDQELRDQVSAHITSSQAATLHTKAVQEAGTLSATTQQLSTSGQLDTGANKPQIHFGRFGSASTVLKSSSHRDKLTTNDKIVGFEMESAGIWDNLPTMLVKSACDYADEHKSKKWQPYAAATAAAGVKAILEYWSTADSINNQSPISINVPDRMVTHLVQRSAIVEDLEKWLFDDAGIAKLVLYGMGGAGKSQLVLQCCKKAIASTQFAAVFWIDASSVLSVQESLKVIAATFEPQLTISNDWMTNLITIQEALKRKRARWLVVFDNFDTPSAFPDSIIDFIPKVDCGRVLFTSRDTGLHRLGRVIHISGMTEEESLDLLLKRSARDEHEKTIGLQIAARLGYLPLALDQAEAYIRKRGVRLENFTSHFELRKRSVLEVIPQHWEYRKRITGSERDESLSVFTTWELSFTLINGSEEIKQGIEHFLTLCAFFDPTAILKSYFGPYCEESTRSWTSIFKNESRWDEDLFDEVVAECRGLSLVQSGDGQENTSLILHPLVRDWLKLRRTAQEQQDIAQEFTNLLVSYKEAIDFKILGQTARQHLLVNVVSCLQEDHRFKDIPQYYTSDLSHSADLFATIYKDSGLYSESEELYKQMLAGSREQLGAQHLDTLRTMQNLALVYDDKGRYDEAETILRQVLACRKEKLGLKHLTTLSSMESLGIVYRNKGKYDDAKELYKQVLPSYTEQLGAKHPDTLRTMQNLAIVYWSKGRYDDAEELYKQVLTGYTEQLGAKHPDTLRTMQNLALIYWNKGRYDDAEELYKQVLTGYTEQLGAKHPETLRTMQNLALVYVDKGRYDDAEELHKQVLTGYTEQLGAEHPDTLRTMYNLAIVYVDKGRYDDAEDLYKQALTGYTEQLGAKHPETTRVMYNLAILYKKLSNYSEAKRLLTQALAGREERLGINHPHTKDTRELLASLPAEEETDMIAQATQKAEEPVLILDDNKQKKRRAMPKFLKKLLR